MNHKQHYSKSLALKLDLSSIIRSREHSMPSRQEAFATLPDQQRQKEVTFTEPTPESERKTNSISPNNHLNLLFYDKTPEKLETSNQGSEYDPRSPESHNEQQEAEISYSDTKSHKKFRDLNKSLANLALKRVTGRSASDNNALNSYFPDKYKAGTDSKSRINSDYYHHPPALNAHKTPVVASKFHYEINTLATKNQEIRFLPSEKDSEMANFNPLDSPFDEPVNKESSQLSSSTNRGNQGISKKLSTDHNQDINKGPRAFHHHHHNTSIGKYQQRKVSNQNIQLHNHPTSNYRAVSSNFVITEVNSPYYQHQEIKDLSQYFNNNSISSIDSARNHLGSRFSGITDEFKGLDMQNVTSIQSKSNLSNLHSHSRKPTPSRKPSSQTLTKNNTINLRAQQQALIAPKNNSITPSFKANLAGSSYFIYDMHQRISRHTKQHLEQRQNSARRQTEQIEEEQKEEADERVNFVGSFRARVEHQSNNSFEEHVAEKLEKKEVSDGVEYRAGGVGIGNSSNSINEKFKQDRSKESLEQLLKQDALRIKRQMQKRKQDYEEFNQFFKMYSHDVKHAKQEESIGNLSERSLADLNTPKPNLKPEVLPTTAVSTQGPHYGNYYSHHPIPILSSFSPGIKIDSQAQVVNKQIVFEGTLNAGLQQKYDEVANLSTESRRVNLRKFSDQVVVERENPNLPKSSCCGAQIKCQIF